MKTLTQNAEEKATEGQIEQITRVAQDAVKKAIKDFGLTKDGAQKVHANGNLLADTANQAVTKVLQELTYVETYEKEEVQSKYGYLSGYTPKGLTEQCNRLRELFSGIGYANLDLLAQIEAGKVELPANAEGWFAIPNIWKKDGQPKIGSTYSECVQKILDTIKETRGRLYNYREGSIDEKHLRQSARTEKFFGELSEAQGNPDILIVAGQFGLRHRGRSVRRAREVFQINEFGFGAFAIGSMLLTHPERLQQSDDLWIDCGGDEFAPGVGGGFSYAPYFYFSGSGVWFGACYVSRACGRFGSSSAFFPPACAGRQN